MNKITMNKEHKMHQPVTVNIIILFVTCMFNKNQFIGIFWQQCHLSGKNSGWFQ